MADYGASGSAGTGHLAPPWCWSGAVDYHDVYVSGLNSFDFPIRFDGAFDFVTDV
jgi:hypothetical protein